MNILKWFFHPNYRTTRSGYWLTLAVTMTAMGINQSISDANPQLAMDLTGDSQTAKTLESIGLIVLVSPFLFNISRRLLDAGRSRWWMLYLAGLYPSVLISTSVLAAWLAGCGVALAVLGMLRSAEHENPERIEPMMETEQRRF